MAKREQTFTRKQRRKNNQLGKKKTRSVLYPLSAATYVLVDPMPRTRTATRVVYKTPGRTLGEVNASTLTVNVTPRFRGTSINEWPSSG